MNLTRDKSVFPLEYGFFGTLYDPDSGLGLLTLERSYRSADGEYFAKLPPGDYTCVRGPHALSDKTGGLIRFETFEVTGVKGHTGILFHTGNTYLDTDGCILLGDAMTRYRLINSRNAFEKFMETVKGINRFQLNVTTS